MGINEVASKHQKSNHLKGFQKRLTLQRSHFCQFETLIHMEKGGAKEGE
jgi:hypothetical protein